MSAALAMFGVGKRFPRGKGQVQALHGLDLTLRAGSVTALLGPDGAGKSTLMRLATGLLLPDQGSVTVLGWDTRQASTQIQNMIGYMPQRFGLYEDLTVQENLDLYADLQGLDRAQRAQRQQSLLALTALGPYGTRRAGALSGGMKQKLGLACALLRAPRLLLLDEPTVGVDPIARRELWSIVSGLREHGTTVLMSTAYFDEAERCDDVILLHQGHLLAQDMPAAFRDRLAGRCFHVRHEHLSRRRFQENLRARPGVMDVRMLANGVRVLLRETVPPARDGEHWQAVAPLFEDAFVSLLGAGVKTAVSSLPPFQGILQGTEAVIEVRDLRRTFGSFEAVGHVAFEVHQGQIFGLLGANGAGKTTTFRMLCGLLPPTSGVMRVAGVDMRQASSLARARIGYVSQRFSLYGTLSSVQNLHFFASAYGLRGVQRRVRLDWAVREFDLEAYGAVNADDLPLGIKQRLALACALLHEPAILFLDEPTSGVDPLARREFWQRIHGLAEGGVTVLVTTHFMDEAEYCDRLVLMSLGKVLAYGSPEEIRARVSSPERPEPTMDDAFIQLVQAHEGMLRRGG